MTLLDKKLRNIEMEREREQERARESAREREGVLTMHTESGREKQRKQ